MKVKATQLFPTSRTIKITATIILLVMLAVLAVCISQCARGAGDIDAGAFDRRSNTVSFSDPESLDENASFDPESKRDDLIALLGEEDAEKLIQAAGESDDALWIATHPEAYEFEGSAVQSKILKLAADEPESLAYVRGFPKRYPADDQTRDETLAMNDASPSPDVPNTEIPHLYQWDRRWAYTEYCSTSFGLAGCGPTSLSMVYQGLTKDQSLTPYDLGEMAKESGYMQEFDGTDYGFFTDIGSELGMICDELYPTAYNITNELENGRVIITNLAPGYFTRYGHFFVLAGLADDGSVIVNDPYSPVRSAQTWDPDFIASESRIMYAYSI